MLGRVADDDAEFTTFTAVDVHFRHHLTRIEIETVGLGTVHDAQAAAFLGLHIFVDDLRDVIHAVGSFSLMPRRPDCRLCSSNLFFSAHSLAIS